MRLNLIKSLHKLNIWWGRAERTIFWSQRLGDAKIMGMKNQKAYLKEVADMVAKGEGPPPPSQKEGTYARAGIIWSRCWRPTQAVSESCGGFLVGILGGAKAVFRTAHRNSKWPVEVGPSWHHPPVLYRIYLVVWHPWSARSRGQANHLVGPRFRQNNAWLLLQIIHHLASFTSKDISCTKLYI